MNSEEIFTIALSLEDPWFIKEIKFDTSNSRLDIYLGFTKGYRFATEGDNFSTAHDTVERSWQHLNFFQHTCYLHAKVSRVKQGDGSVNTQAVPWARSKSGFTLLFEAFISFVDRERDAC